MICDICPHSCDLQEGQTGKCRIIRCLGSKLVNEYFGHCAILALEPIEKRPFFHFDAGGSYLSVGLLGCSMSCSFCQNYKISQTNHYDCQITPPAELVASAYANKAGLAFTFNEPTVHYDYICRVGQVSKNEQNIIVKTNGFATKKTWGCLRAFVDAYNIDIKGDEDEYQKICGASLRPVMESVEFLFAYGHHIEISYLVVPSLLAKLDFHSYIADWLSSISRDIPVHVLYCYPCYGMTDKYEEEELLKVHSVFSERLRFVYISNLHSQRFTNYRDTRCPKCGRTLVTRNGRAVVVDKKCCEQIIIKG